MYDSLYDANPVDIDDFLQQKTVRSLIEEVGFEEEVFRRVVTRQLEKTGISLCTLSVIAGQRIGLPQMGFNVI